MSASTRRMCVRGNSMCLGNRILCHGYMFLSFTAPKTSLSLSLALQISGKYLNRGAVSGSTKLKIFRRDLWFSTLCAIRLIVTNIQNSLLTLQVSILFRLIFSDVPLESGNSQKKIAQCVKIIKNTNSDQCRIDSKIIKYIKFVRFSC